MKPEPFAIFFPPRILFPDFEKGGTKEIMDDAVDRYLGENICLVDENGMKDAQKILAFAEAYPHILHPPVGENFA